MGHIGYALVRKGQNLIIYAKNHLNRTALGTLLRAKVNSI